MTPGPVRRALAAAALVATSVLLALAAGEAALRLIGFSYPMLHVPDDLAGVRLRAGAEGTYREEGEALVRINSDGWRDRERTRAKPPNVVRIAVLGDSFMEAVQVDFESTFSALLERELNDCQAYGKRAVEVLNFGVSSYGTAQQLLTLRERVWPYAPDVVLLAFLPSNDVRNNSAKLEGWKARPFFELRDGRLALNSTFRDDPAFREKLREASWQASWDRLRLYQLVRKARDGTYRGWNDAPAAGAVADGKAAGLAEAGIAERVYLPPAEADWRDAWTITERLILAINAEVRGRNARFAALVLPSPAAVYPDAELRERYARALGVTDLSYPENRIRRLGETAGFDVIPLEAAMQRNADATRTYLHGFSNTRLGFGHWNPAGHAVAARIVAERFCAQPEAGRKGIEPAK